MIYQFKEYIPVIHESSFVHPQAAVIGNVIIGKDCLAGMNSVILDNVQLGDESIVGALTFIKEGEIIPPRSLVAGNPEKLLNR